MVIENILDFVCSATGIVATIILCFFPAKQRMRFLAFSLYVIANLTLGILAYLKGIPMTAGREVIYLACSFVGMAKDWPRG